MIQSIGSALGSADTACLFAVDILLKATLILAVAYAVHAGLGRRRALVQSAMWNAALVGLLLLPALNLALPRTRLAVLPAPSPRVSQSVSAVAITRDHSALADAHSTLAEQSSMPPQGGGVVPARADSTPPPEYLASAPPMAAQSPIRAKAMSGDALAPAAQFARFSLAIYLAIVAILAIRLAASLVAVRTLKRQCDRVDQAAWLQALDRAKKSTENCP